MDDGSRKGKGASIATNCFTLEEVNFLCKVLKSKYNIIATSNKCGKNKGHIIYIHSNSMKLFISIVKPYLLHSLYYKLVFIKIVNSLITFSCDVIENDQLNYLRLKIVGYNFDRDRLVQ